MWRRSDNPLIGIDIGSHAIKLVRLGRVGTAYQLLNVGLEPLPADTVVDGVISDIPFVQRLLARLIKREKIRDKDVALALSGHSVIVKKVQMVRMSADELANAMPYAAEEHIPFDVYDVNSDFHILDAADSKPHNVNQMEVLLAAAKKGRVEELTRAAQGARLNPLVIDVDTLALTNNFELNYPEDVPGHVISLVHCGASMLTVLVLRDGATIFQRDITLGGNQYTAALQKTLALGREDAEAVKLGVQRWKGAPTEVLTTLYKVTEEVVAEIQRSFEFYLVSIADEAIEKVYLSGGSCRLTGLSEVLTARLNIPVEVIDPFRRVDISEKLFDLDYIRAIGPMVAVAAGLALRLGDEV